MKKVKTIPVQEYAAKRDPWLDSLLDGELWQLEPADWSARYTSVRSASSAVKQAAEHRGIEATVAIRGDSLYVQAAVVTKPPVKKAATKAPAKKAAAKTVTPIKKAATRRPPKAQPEAVAS